MRWLVAALGVLGLAGAAYLGLEPRLRRPTLRVALNLRPSNPGDAAVAAGVALALDERDERAGRYRVKTAHQAVQPDGSVQIPRPGAHTMLPGLELLDDTTDGVDGRVVPVDARREAATLLGWMRDRKLTRLALIWWATNLEEAAPTFGVEAIQVKPGRNVMNDSAAIRAARADAVHVYSYNNYYYKVLLNQLRQEGFKGPVFIASETVRPSVWTLDDIFVVLAPLTKAPPPDFLRRHPHPFAYAGYRATLRYLDALDAGVDFTETFPRWSGFDDLKDEPRVFEVKNARFHPVPPK